jgi:hypothetical protein
MVNQTTQAQHASQSVACISATNEGLSSWLGVAGVALSLILVSVAFSGAFAQQPPGAPRSEPPHIRIAATIVAEPGSQIRLPIDVGATEALPRGCFVRLQGLPSTVSLSDGFTVQPGWWIVPAVGLAELRANVSPATAGQFEILVNLMATEGRLLAEAKTVLVIGSSTAVLPVEQSSAVPQQRQEVAMPTQAGPRGQLDQTTSPAGPKELSAEDATRAEKLVAQGERYLADANIEAARQFFRRAADIGYAVAAIKLGTTFDPVELARLGLRDVAADRALASKWYERARELGAPEAAERLARLNGS